MAKGDHDATMNNINQNRSYMNNQYGQNNQNFGGQLGQANQNYNSQYSNFNNNLANFHPNYSFTNQFNKPGGNQGGGINPQTPINGTFGSPGANALAANAQGGSEFGTGGIDTSGAPGTTISNRGSGGNFDYSSYDPQLASIFQNAGVTPTGAGSGNTDIAYWQGKIASAPDDATKQYYLGRIQSDLAGNGPDNGGGQGPQMDLGFIQNWNPQSRSYYQNFADTGGLSQQDIQDMRARGVAPTRSMYSNAQDEMQRQLALSGGASGTNYNAALASMNRDESNQIFNQNQAVNAGIAGQVQQGKEFGTQGLGGLDTTQLQALLSGNEANLGAAMQQNQIQSNQEIAGNQNQLQALGLQLQGMGLSQQQEAMLMNGLLTNQGQQGSYNLGSNQNMISASQIPSNYQQVMGNAGSAMGMMGQAGNLMSMFGGGGGNGFNGFGGGGNSGGYNGYGTSGFPGDNISGVNNPIMSPYTGYSPEYGYGGMPNYGGNDFSGLPGYGTDPNAGYNPGYMGGS